MVAAGGWREREQWDQQQPSCTPPNPSGLPCQQVLLPNWKAATGAGQTIAIVDAYNDPNIAGDLNTFDRVQPVPRRLAERTIR